MHRTKRRALSLAAVLGLIVIAMAGLAYMAVRRHQNTLRLADAVRKGDAAEVQSALADGADPNAPASPAALTLADTLQLMFHLRPPKEEADTIFLYAAEHDNERILRSLLDAGGDVRKHIGNGGTALTRAVASQSHGNVALLVKFGADLNCYGQSDPPLAAALDRRKPNTEDLQFLLAHGADPNGYDQYGITPLMWAAFDSSPENVPLLLKAGANLNARDSVGATALMHAAVSGNLKATEALLKVGADSTLRDNRGRPAEDIAVAMGKKPCAQLISHYRLRSASPR